jgi:hypothetical protein
MGARRAVSQSVGQKGSQSVSQSVNQSEGQSGSTSKHSTSVWTNRGIRNSTALAHSRDSQAIGHVIQMAYKRQ